MADIKERIATLEEDRKIQEYTEKLRALRADGVTRINDCRIEIASIRKNKLIDQEERNMRIRSLEAEIEKAKEVAAANKAEIAALSKEAVKYVNSVSKEIEKAVNEKQNRKMAGAKDFYEKEVAQIKAKAAEREEETKNRLAGGAGQGQGRKASGIR